MYADSFTCPEIEAVNQLIAHVRILVAIWIREGLEFPSGITVTDSKGDRVQNALLHSSRATSDHCFLYVNRIFIAAQSEWFTDYVRERLGCLFDNCIAELTEEFGAVK